MSSLEQKRHLLPYCYVVPRNLSRLTLQKNGSQNFHFLSFCFNIKIISFPLLKYHAIGCLLIKNNSMFLEYFRWFSRKKCFKH